MSYLLVQDSIKNSGVKDADGLYEHLLIDVQMGVCMNASRIVQANAAIQLFINRILLNLEGNIPPNAIDTEQWEWMKNYRVWEANRKVFLYPENWLEPEWRNDRSEFFKDLESHLLQNDITERSVEQGLRNYLMSMNEVANLDVCGMHQENDEDGKLKFLHVFGRTHNLPYKYFYRRWNEYQKWSAWEKVSVDIRGVEDVENSGVHLIPVAWKGRLFLFWPEFMEMAKSPSELKDVPIKDQADLPSEELEPEKYWEIRLAWSEYVDGAWSAKQVTGEYISTGGDFFHSFGGFPDPNDSKTPENLKPYQFRVIPSISRNNLQLTVWAGSFGPSVFTLSDIQSPISSESNLLHFHVTNLKYRNEFSKLSRTSSLEFSGNDYLKSRMFHKLVPINTEPNLPPNIKLDLTLENVFFYGASNRTYFVRSAGTEIIWDHENNLNPHNLVNKMFFIASPTGVTDSIFRPRNSFVDVAFSPREFSYGSITRVKTLEFHTFYHPFSSKFLTRLNKGV